MFISNRQHDSIRSIYTRCSTSEINRFLIIIFMASITTPSSNSSLCAACKFLRRKCTPNCIFARYFPVEDPAKFSNVHRVFGANNVRKLLSDLPVGEREAAVHSLSFEAETFIREPVNGCVPQVLFLQDKLKEVQEQLAAAKNELAQYEHGGGVRHLASTSSSSSASPEVPFLLQQPNAADSNTNRHN